MFGHIYTRPCLLVCSDRLSKLQSANCVNTDFVHQFRMARVNINVSVNGDCFCEGQHTLPGNMFTVWRDSNQHKWSLKVAFSTRFWIMVFSIDIGLLCVLVTGVSVD